MKKKNTKIIKKSILSLVALSSISLNGLHNLDLEVSAKTDGAIGYFCRVGDACINFKRHWKNLSSYTKNSTVYVYTDKTDSQGRPIVESRKLGDHIQRLVKSGFWTPVEADFFWKSQFRWLQSDPAGNLHLYDEDIRTEDEYLPGIAPSFARDMLRYLINNKPGFRSRGMAIFNVDHLAPSPPAPSRRDYDSPPPPTRPSNPGIPYTPPPRIPTIPNNPTPPSPPPPPPAPVDEINCEIGAVRASAVVGSEESTDLYVTGTEALRGIITPIRPKGFENLTEDEKEEWNRTHVSQTIQPERTEYGRFLQSSFNSLKNATSLTQEEYQRLANKLREMDRKPFDLSEQALNEVNKTGFQRGGAFTFTQMKRQMTLKATQVTSKSTVMECKVKYKQDRYGQTYRVANWENTGMRTNDPVIKNLQLETASLAPGGWTIDKSYQILNVRCNKDEFDKLITSTGSTDITESMKTGISSSSAVSPTVKNRVAQFYNHLDTNFFYGGKDCENNFLCKVIPLEDGPRNEISRNQNNKGINEGTFGAQSEDKSTRELKSSDSFKFFRDNSDNAIRIDVWYPSIEQATNDFTYTAMSEPDRTYIALDPNGTPREDLFTLKDNDDKVVIDKNVPTDKYYAKWNKLMNTFKWNGAFATDDRNPHRMNIKYAYLLPVRVTTPYLAGDTIGDVEELDSENLELMCDTTFNSLDSTKPVVRNSPSDESLEASKKFDDSKDKYLEVRFLKSATEE